MRTDCHIHIGQYERVYYHPHKVIKALGKCGVKALCLSSTTSCMGWENKFQKNLIISHIHDEFIEALNIATEMKIMVLPLYWVIPQQIYEGDNIRSIFQSVPYKGFKIHPRAHNWDLADNDTRSLMNEICNYAEKEGYPIFIHTGACDFESAEKFELWFSLFPKVKFVLAHCKNIDATLIMLKKYENIYGDTAFYSNQAYNRIIEAGYSSRLIFGTDFPITMNTTDRKGYSVNELIEEYKKIIKSCKCLNGFEYEHDLYKYPFISNLL